MASVPGFTRKAIVGWANADLSPGCVVTSDGLGCFAGVTDAGCQHRAIIAGGRKPKDLPKFNWINTVLGNLKTSLGGVSCVRFRQIRNPLPGSVCLSV